MASSMVISNSNELVSPSQFRRLKRNSSNNTKREKIVKNIPCPECRAKGNDSTGNHLMVFESGSGYCAKCPKSFTKEMIESSEDDKKVYKRKHRYSYQNSYTKELQLSDMDYLGFIGDTSRGISSETDRYFGIRTEIDENTRKPVTRYYPYYIEKDLSGYKPRNLPKNWGKDIGSIKGSDLFGWHKLKGSKHTLIIVEGEEDCAAGYQLWKSMNLRSSNRRVRRSSPHIVSLPNGAKGLTKIYLKHIEELLKYEKIIWMGDNYKTDSEGLLALEETVRVLGVNRVYVAEYPEYKKDLCDINKVGAESAIDLFSEMYFNAKPYSPNDVIEGCDLERSDVEKEPVVGYKIRFEGINEMMGGLRLYEHTLFFSGSGMGKSTLCRDFGYNMCVDHGFMVGNIYLEERVDKTAQGYIAYDNDISLQSYRQDFSRISDEQYALTKKRVLDKMLFLNHNGSIDPDVLMDKIRYLHSKGCSLIILDHLSMAVTGADDERKDIDNLMEQLYRFCDTHPIHVISVVHLSRDAKRDFTRGAEITVNNLRGSSGLIQMCWNAIGLEGDNQHEDSILADTRYPRFLKCRETGEVGLSKGSLEYSKGTGKFTENTKGNREDIIQNNNQGDSIPRFGGSYDNKAS